MKAWWRRQRKYFLGGIVYGFARSIGVTLRLRVIGREHYKDLKCGKVFVGWHGKTFIPANYFHGKGVWALFSLSNDGELQSRIFKRFGFQVIRGSTGRGGARALIESIRVLREGDSMAITPDGPRGPAGVVQSGVLAMAQKSGAALVPVGTASKPGTRLGTWDRYLVPWFFAKAAIVFHAPIFVPEDATPEHVEAIRHQVQTEIEAAETEAESACGIEQLPASSRKDSLEATSETEPGDQVPREG